MNRLPVAAGLTGRGAANPPADFGKVGAVANPDAAIGTGEQAEGTRWLLRYAVAGVDDLRQRFDADGIASGELLICRGHLLKAIYDFDAAMSKAAQARAAKLEAELPGEENP